MFVCRYTELISKTALWTAIAQLIQLAYNTHSYIHCTVANWLTAMCGGLAANNENKTRLLGYQQNIHWVWRKHSTEDTVHVRKLTAKIKITQKKIHMQWATSKQIHTCTQHMFKSHFNKTHVQVLHVHHTMGKSNPGHDHN